MFRRFMLLFPFLVSGPVVAGSFDVNLSEETARVIFGTSLGSLHKGNEAEFGYLFNEDDQSIAHVGLMFAGENWSSAGTFEIALGARLLYVDADPFDVGALALGGRVRFSPIQRFGLGVEGFYAPNVTTSMDGERYSEASFRADYQVLPQGYIYVGYRWIRVRFEDVGSTNLDEDINAGMRFVF